MRRGQPSKLFEFLVILLVVVGLRAASSADVLGAIEGTVITGFATPVSGATVTIRCGSVSRTVTTNASGQFTASGLPAGGCTVSTAAAGFTARSMSVTVAASGTAKLVVPLRKAEERDTKKTELEANKVEAKPADKPKKYAPAEAPAPIVAATPSTPMPKPPGRYPVTTKARVGFQGAPAQPLVMDHQPGHNTEAYDRIEDNPFFRTTKEPLSTFSIDVDTASYSNLRRFLKDGSRPPKDAVRIEEMLNYFRYDYGQPEKGDPFSITTEIGPSPWNAKHQLVRIGLKALAIDDAKVPARNLVFLLDVSGSMQDANKLPLLKQSMGLLVETLRPEDKVSMVVYAGAAGLVLPPTSGREKEAIRNAIARLEAGGSTNGAAGIQLAYEVAARTFIKGGINRVILCSDGDYNVGITSEGDLTRLIEKERQRGVFLTVLGFGMGNLKDSTMEKLADKGNGNYGYIDSLFEARKVLVKEAGATLVTVAKDVKLQIEFNPALVAGHRLIGYENRILRHEDFNDDKKDAGEIGAGHTVTAIYEIVPAGVEVPAASKVDDLKYQTKTAPSVASASGELMTVKIRYKAPDGDTSKLLSRAVKGTATELAKTSTDFRWAAAIAGFGMLLRESPHRGNLTWKQVHALAQGAVGNDTEGYRKQALDMIVAASRMSTPSP